jgi:hypothetical protein
VPLVGLLVCSGADRTLIASPAASSFLPRATSHAAAAFSSPASERRTSRPRERGGTNGAERSVQCGACGAMEWSAFTRSTKGGKGRGHTCKGCGNRLNLITRASLGGVPLERRAVSFAPARRARGL